MSRSRPRLPRLLSSLLLSLVLFRPGIGLASDLALGYVPAPGPGEKPALLLTPSRTVTELYVEIQTGGATYPFERANLAGGKQVRLEWKRDSSVESADVFIRAVYSDGFVEELSVPISWSYGGQLSVDLSRAAADVAERTLAVRVSSAVETADITAYGARKVVLDQSTVKIGAGPGDISIPWTGDPGEVVLLDVTLRGGNAWTGFTYSPWFLDVPHEDVLFASDSDVIDPTETWKLEATLKELQSVLEKYGELVPVKLYLAGCTDTVGDSGHNRDLSLRRARSIGRWLRAHGYDKPIYFHGFGEGLLSVQTGDGVDNISNRRVLYMVGANPPPAGSGVPAVSWTAL
jgi:outer membrane protein OmpA-like peptidoglycan-associated protein